MKRVLHLKPYIQIPNKADWLIIATYWLLSFIFLIPTYFSQATFGVALTLLLYNVVIDTVFVIILVYMVLPLTLQKNNFWLPVLTVVFLLLFSMVFYRFGYRYIMNKPQDWSFYAIIGGVIYQAQSLGILLSILAMKKFHSSQQNILKLEKANIESSLKVLSNQIAPHFLFNNLNVLQSLVQSNPKQAAVFVKHLSAIYRYLIKHKDEDVVFLNEELNFASDYIYLLNQRFGNAYVFKSDINSEDALKKIVPSCCLQVLLENIVKHNQGNEQNPLLISIQIDENQISVCNEIRPKYITNDFSGTGLQNLNERYQLLSDHAIFIEKNNNFKVVLPLIKQLKSI